jgi:hypothetical protein
VVVMHCDVVWSDVPSQLPQLRRRMLLGVSPWRCVCVQRAGWSVPGAQYSRPCSPTTPVSLLLCGAALRWCAFMVMARLHLLVVRRPASKGKGG